MSPTHEHTEKPEKPAVPEKKEKLVRNREVDKAADQMVKEHALPSPPGLNITYEQMQAYLALLTRGMWGHLSVYVYRLRPKIRRQLTNPNVPNYIDCFGEPFTEQYFISRHGGGRYLFEACDTDKRGENKVFQCTHTIDDTKHPPILDYGELELDARENTSYITWLKNQGILDSKGQQLKPEVPNLSSNGSITAKDMMEMLSFISKMNADQQNQLKAKLATDEDSLSKSVGTLLLEKMKQDDPAKHVQVATALVSAMKDVIGTSKSDSGSIERLITMLSEARKTDLEYMRLILDSKAPPPAEDSFTKFQQVFQFARELISDTSRQSGRRSGWDVALDAGRDILMPAVQTIGGIIQQGMALKHGQPIPGAPGAAAAPPIPLAFDPYRNQAATAQYAQTLRQQPAAAPAPQPAPAPAPQPQAPAPAPAAAPAPSGAPPIANHSAMNAQVVQIFQQYGGLVVGALNQGLSGDAFADNVVNLLGTGTHAMIVQPGEVELSNVMMAIPEIAIFGEPRIRRFVWEFVHFDEIDAPNEDAAIDDDEDTIDTTNVYQPPTTRPAARAYKP